MLSVEGQKRLSILSTGGWKKPRFPPGSDKIDGSNQPPLVSIPPR